MRMLVHRVAVNSAAPFNLSAIKAHMRVDGDHDDAAIENIAWTAAEDIQDFAQIALLAQNIRVSVFEPDLNASFLRLPVGPVLDDAQISVTLDGAAFTGFDLVRGNRPMLRWACPTFEGLLPSRINIEYEAGFGAEADAIPRDLAQAVMDQAALLYDGRSPMDTKSLFTSPHMARIGARYRGVSL